MATPGQSVNRPTNTKQKEQDITQKLQLYGILTAFSNGKVPSVSFQIYIPKNWISTNVHGRTSKLMLLSTASRGNRS
jgi:hypothetical protein